MAFEYFLYDTNFNNTLVDRSANSFAPLPPNTGEIFIDFNIPQTQPPYLYRESVGTIILNDNQTIEDYLNATEPPTGEDSVLQEEFTGYTATTEILINTKIDKVPLAVQNNIAVFDNNGEVLDSGFSISGVTDTGTTDTVKFQSVKSGDQIISDIQSGIITWNIANPIENNYFTFNTTLGELTFLKDGWYDISYNASVFNIAAGTNRTQAEVWLQEDLASTGFTNINGTASAYYLRQQTYGTAGSAEIFRQYSLGQKIRLTVQRTAGTANVSIIGKATILKVLKSETWLNTTQNTYSITGNTAVVGLSEFNAYTAITDTRINNIIYGSEYQLASDLTSTSTTSTTPVVKLTMITTNLPNATYKITSAWIGRHSSASNDMIFDITLNGVPQGTISTMNIEGKDINSNFPFSRILYLPLSGINTIELRYWNEGGTTIIADTTIEVIRVN